MSITTVVAWFGWVMILLNSSPTSATPLVFTFFYISLFLSLLGTLSVIGCVLRFILQRQRRANAYKVSTAFRQAFLWSLALVIALGLQSQRLLSWWLIVLLVAVFTMLEFTFLSLSKSRLE